MFYRCHAETKRGISLLCFEILFWGDASYLGMTSAEERLKFPSAFIACVINQKIGSAA